MTKIDSLTGLRLFAALAVFASHTQPPTTLPGPTETLMYAGYSGVTLFFVLSGFVLTWTYADRMASSSDRTTVRDFAVARFARIAPLYFTALAFGLLVSRDNLPPRAWMHLLTLQTWSGDLAIAWGFNPPAWSIGVETFLYALFPLLLWALLPLNARKIALVVVGTLLALGAVTLAVYLAGGNELPIADAASDHRWLYRTPLTRLPDFIVGMCVALIVRRSNGTSRWASAAQLGSVAAIVALMSSELVLDSIVSWDMAYLPVVGLLIWSLAAAPEAPLARVLAHPLLVRGGLVSFAFYLFHYPILGLLNISYGDGLVWATTVATGLVITMLVAIGAHLAIEVPAQRWLRHRLSSRRAHDLPVILEQEPTVVPVDGHDESPARHH